MSSEFGKILKVSVFGESHGSGIGCVVDGLPSGEDIDIDALCEFMRRRAPGQAHSTPRKESDTPKFLSGVYSGKTTGSPLCAVIENSDTHSSDYNFYSTPRPSHADYTARQRYKGYADMRGSGHFSGRLTAPLCVAGGIALQILTRKGIYIGTHLQSVGQLMDEDFPLYPDKALFEEISKKPIATISDDAADAFAEEIEKVRSRGDSVGGCIEVAVTGLKAGVGSPMFDGVENRIAQAVFGIPGVKGLEFGMGFASARLNGSQNNDEFMFDGDKIKTKTNNAGGIIGGITTGMPITFRAAMKPTPSISLRQGTVDIDKGIDTDIEIKGRHDPCIALRAVPVFEAVTALVILDLLLEDFANGFE